MLRGAYGLMSQLVSLAVAFAVIVGLPAPAAQAQDSCFEATGFCLKNPLFREYFLRRGGERTLGLPISREFALQGSTAQVFQRVVLILQNGNVVSRLTVFDPAIMPITRANGATFPSVDPAVVAMTPQMAPSSPIYAGQIRDFVQRVVPDSWNGIAVGFHTLFDSSVGTEAASPGTVLPPDIKTLLNLEIWGFPTSYPTRDPRNPGFIYQRFQRGIMHYRSFDGTAASGVPVGQLLKVVMTGQGLPDDLAEDVAGGRFFRQYDPSLPQSLRRPADLPNTDLANTFEQEVGNPAPVQSAICVQPYRTGCPVGLNSPVEGVVSEASTVHTWRFPQESPGTVRVVLTDLPVDYDLHIQGPDSTKLGDSINEGTQDEVLEVTTSAAGDLIVYVDVNASRGTMSPQPYRLIVSTP